MLTDLQSVAKHDDHMLLCELTLTFHAMVSISINKHILIAVSYQTARQQHPVGYWSSHEP